MREIEIAGRKIGSDHPCFIIAEAGVNHNGDIRLAEQLVKIAGQAGVDAIKFQTFIAETVITPDAPKADYQKLTTGAEQSQLEMLKGLELPFEAFRHLKKCCDSQGVMFLSTPFDDDSADFLHELGVPAFKIPSGEVTNHPFLEHVARKRMPIILSTGMCYMNEVEQAVRVIYQTGNRQLALLHCVSSYPSAAQDINLRAMESLRQAFDLPVGFSDHSEGIAIPIAAAARGACIIEKHFTLDCTLPGPDHKASLEPQELMAMVRGIRATEASLGDGVKKPTPDELKNRDVARKSVIALVDIPQGQTMTREMLGIRRPGTGIAPGDLERLIGLTLNQDVTANTVLTWKMLATRLEP